MSAHRDCSGCMNGDHGKHDGSHNGLPGVLGGWICVCKGGCGVRHRKRMDDFFGPYRVGLEAAGDSNRDGRR